MTYRITCLTPPYVSTVTSEALGVTPREALRAFARGTYGALIVPGRLYSVLPHVDHNVASTLSGQRKSEPVLFRWELPAAPKADAIPVTA